jgi:hypothetical protein
LESSRADLSVAKRAEDWESPVQNSLGLWVNALGEGHAAS